MKRFINYGYENSAIGTLNICKEKRIMDLSIEVKRDQIFALIGPNNSGKSTLLDILSTKMAFSSG